MNRTVPGLVLLAATAATLGLAATAAVAASEPPAAAPVAAHAASVTTAAKPLGVAAERGRYLVEAIGCSDCHTPKVMTEHGPEPDRTRLLSGHPEGALPPAPVLPAGPWIAVTTGELTAWNGPWGTSFAMNLTPDEDTGIGIWTEEMFLSTIRTGRHMGQSRPLLPPMPWQMYRNLNDEDLKAIYAYLRTIPPVHNRVPDPLPPPSAAGASEPAAF